MAVICDELTITPVDLNEVRRVIGGFREQVHIVNLGLVMIFDAYDMDGIGESLYHMDVNQQNLHQCYEDHARDVVIHCEKKT